MARRKRSDQAGYAIFTVTLFALVVIIAGASVFAVASYETRGALYRQNSLEAFYLADGAIERSRAQFLDDRTWRDGWSGVAAGAGTYDLAAADTACLGYDDVVRLRATGHVRNADRRIETLVRVPPSAFDLTMLIVGDASVGGNLCLDGNAHVNGDAQGNNPNQPPHFTCGYSYTEGFVITPPPIFTDPGHFPGTTYYYVRGNKIGGTYQARIYDAAGTDITTALGDSLTNITTYQAATNTFIFDFGSHAVVEKYFNDSTGVFKRNPGDVAAVVNFGEPPVVDPPALLGVSALRFDGSAASTIHATVINTRFTGVADSLRIDWSYWMGAVVEVRQIRFEPYQGIALVAYDVNRTGSAQVHIGTEAWPALLYVTRDVDSINSDFYLVGSMICLRDFVSTGGPQFIYNEGFIDLLPDWMMDDWLEGGSGTMEILPWRETAVTGH